MWTIDHDDGSQYFNDTGNFMVWGGCKNYLGNHKVSVFLESHYAADSLFSTDQLIVPDGRGGVSRHSKQPLVFFVWTCVVLRMK